MYLSITMFTPRNGCELFSRIPHYMDFLPCSYLYHTRERSLNCVVSCLLMPRMRTRIDEKVAI